jgi:hypothetical protein
LLGSPSDPELVSVDLDLLVTKEIGEGTLPPIRISRYLLTRPMGDAPLVLTVEAPDQIGFLAQLLGELSFFSLFPVEMRIETVHGVVRDRVHLRSVAGTAPSEEALDAVKRGLDRLVAPASGPIASQSALIP